ncbi:hypothetical protein ABZX95_37615 [Streptomyces sp. NPDC004232]|uniref:hypothetical protein n=1 Tax=Streptomyces sp. NPDC004232 TaxID=3154454 RepID=UPI001D614873|nr:hypothetical protein [Streptomyces sp. tea 10]
MPIFSALQTLPDVPRWARNAARLAVLTPLPSSLWRLPMAWGWMMGFGPEAKRTLHVPGWGSLYIVGLTVFSEVFAFLTLGLVQSWGEVWPRWVPGLRGRSVPVPAAVIPALAGAGLVMLYSAGLIHNMFVNPDPDAPHGISVVVLNLCYAPIILWGPLLLAVTVHYWRRRRRT